MGSFQNIKIARTAICNLILGKFSWLKWSSKTNVFVDMVMTETGSSLNACLSGKNSPSEMFSIIFRFDVIQLIGNEVFFHNMTPGAVNNFII